MMNAMCCSIHDLLRLDYRVVTCLQGAEALEILRSAEPVHVILSDQKMPEMTGVEVLATEKSSGRRPLDFCSRRMLISARSSMPSTRDTSFDTSPNPGSQRSWKPQCDKPSSITI